MNSFATVDGAYIWAAILLMTLVTYASRLAPFILLNNRKLPRWFSQWLTYVPTAVFGALIFPDVFMQGNSLDFSLSNLNLWATVIAFPVAYKTRSLAATLVVGAVAFSALAFGL